MSAADRNTRMAARHPQRVDPPVTNFSRVLPERVRQEEEPILRPDKRRNEDLERDDNSRKRHPAASFTASLRWLMLIVALLPPQHTFAQEGAAKPRPPFTVPLPPPRPENPSASPGTSAFSAAAPALAQPAPQQEPPRQPRLLPPTSRARMHTCGLEWQKLKETGLAADKTWFEFAQLCLAK